MNISDFISRDELVVSLVKKASWFQKLRARIYPVKLGMFHPVEHNAPTVFYLFVCNGCRKHSCDYIHGESYLSCHYCR